MNREAVPLQEDLAEDSVDSHRDLQEEALAHHLFSVVPHRQWVLEGRLRQLDLVDHDHLSLQVEVDRRSRPTVWDHLQVVSQEVHLHSPPTAALQMVATFLPSQVISLHQAKDLLVKALRVLLVLLLSRKGPQQMLGQVGCIRIE